MHICSKCNGVTYKPTYWGDDSKTCESCSAIRHAGYIEERILAARRKVDAVQEAKAYHEYIEHTYKAYKDGKVADTYKDCGIDECQECCPHDEFDHDQCLACGYERDPGAAIDAAMDSFEDR